MRSTYYLISDKHNIASNYNHYFDTKDKLCKDCVLTQCDKCPTGYYLTTHKNILEFCDNNKQYIYEVALPLNAIYIKHNDYITRSDSIIIKSRANLYSCFAINKFNLEITRTYLINYLINSLDLHKTKLDLAKKHKNLLDYIFIINLYINNKKDMLKQLYKLNLITREETYKCIDTFCDYEEKYKNISEFLSEL